MEQLELFSMGRLTSSAAELLAKTSPSQENERGGCAEAERAPLSAGPGSILSAISALGGSYGRTCRDVSVLANPSTEATLPNSRLRLQNSGMIVRGALWTFSTPEWTHFRAPSPSADAVCGLSDILEPMETEADLERLRKYFLSERACSGILRRAAARGKELPPELKTALTEQIRMWRDGELAETHTDDGDDTPDGGCISDD